MATITPQSSARVATDLVWVAATVTTGDQWVNTGNEMLLVNNASGAPINVTIPTPILADGNLTVADKVIAVGAGKIGFLGPFPRATYSDAADSFKAKAVCSSVTSVTLAVVKRGTA